MGEITLVSGDRHLWITVTVSMVSGDGQWWDNCMKLEVDIDGITVVSRGRN